MDDGREVQTNVPQQVPHDVCEGLYFFINSNSNGSFYAIRLNHPLQRQHFQRQFISFCFSSTHFESTSSARDRCSSILDHFLNTFLTAVYCNPKTSKGLEVLESFISELLFQISDKLVAKTASGNDDLKMRQEFVIAVLQGGWLVYHLSIFIYNN